MSIRLLLVIFSSWAMVSSQWSFAVAQVDDGAFIPDWKDKEVGYSFGEDYFVVTPYGIVVADGVGGSNLASLHISKHLATSFAQWILGCKYLEQPESSLPLCKNREKKNDLETIKDVMNDIMSEHIEDLKKSKKETWRHLESSSTFVSAYFSRENSSEKKQSSLNIFQKGDSLALILRFDTEGNNWKPFAYTSEDQYEFNQPYQYSVYRDLSFENLIEDEDNRFFSIEPKEKDVVILGSDGLFDNVPVSIITLAFNTLVKNYSNRTKPNSRIPLRKLLEAYQRIIGHLTVAEFLESGQNTESTALYDEDDFAADWEERQKMKKEHLEHKADLVDPNKMLKDTGDNLNIQSKVENENIKNINPSIPKELSDTSHNKNDSQPNDIDELSTESVKLSKSNPEKCMTKDLFFHKKIDKNNQTWGFKGLLDSCFEKVLNKMFNFDRRAAANFQSSFNPKFVSNSLAEFAKEMTVEPRKFVSPFWVHLIANTLKNNSGNTKSPNIPSFYTKPDDITVIAALVIEEDIHFNPITEEEEDIDIISSYNQMKDAELKIANRLNFMEKRNKLELYQDIDFIQAFWL